MSKSILNKLTQIGASLATITVLTSAPSVQAATLFYDLSFLDDSGEKVGSGSFSYDDTAPFEGIFEHPYEPINVDASEGWYQLQSFEAQINGLNWNIGNSVGGEKAVFWRPFETEKLASVIRDRFGVPDKRPGIWLFGDTRFLPALLVDADSWVQFALNTPTGIIFGAWEATQRPTTPVPEPTSILSLMIFGVGSLVITSKKSFKN